MSAVYNRQLKVPIPVSQPKIRPRSDAGYRAGLQVRIMRQRERPSWKDGEAKNRVQKADCGLAGCGRISADQSQAAGNRVKLSENFVLHVLSRR